MDSFHPLRRGLAVRVVSALGLAAAAVTILALPGGAPAQTGGVWAGTWDTTYGTMVLRQTGTVVEGTYETDEGRIRGTVTGNVLRGRWTEVPTRTGPVDAGAIQFTMAADGNSWNGLWNYDQDTDLTRTWTGTRAGAPLPVLGKSVNVAVVSGEVRIKLPAGAAAAQTSGNGFEPLTEERQIPVGSQLDTTRGVVQLVSRRDRAGRTQTGRFSAGVFQVLQARRKRGLTELRLKSGRVVDCRRGRGASAAARRAIRRLKGNARGRFRTRGRHSAATVRGTVWTVTDRCDGTLTKVTRGRVVVRDFTRRKTVVVRAGKSYLARAND